MVRVVESLRNVVREVRSLFRRFLFGIVRPDAAWIVALPSAVRWHKWHSLLQHCLQAAGQPDFRGGGILNQNEHTDAAYNRQIFSVYLEVKDLATFSQHPPMGGHPNYFFTDAG
ncbi:hypothetical protein JTB14_019903 [Gonioctena quinquepunctata]|nr:hypothetical protein JTB14_019903 [Gonioctena quinquepunctata]